MTLDATILKLIEAQEIVDQSRFMALLKQAGQRVTQPTLSRHLAKLGVQKVAGRYQRVELTATELPAYTVSAVQPNLIIIKTRPGYAQALAVRLDQRQISGVAGTLAGDDTIFIAVSSPKALQTAVGIVEEILEARSPG
ncbi:MAG TPA: arginine repressor [Gammaproteobacteria bacterium]|nr:arginine repressor [Gammaproteobacteria bacterium]